MRISTSTIFEAGSAKLSDLQASLVRQQEQIATGRRMLTPADDPVAAARALEVTQTQSANTQFGVNRQNAKDSLSQEESSLQSVTSLLQDVKTLTVNAGNGSLDDTQRKSLATQLQGQLDTLLGLANSRDSTGNYLFAGYQITSQPFAQSPTGATYLGDQGPRLLQVGPSQQLEISDSGNAVFERNKTGNGVFLTAAATAAIPASATTVNAGSGVISSGSVTNAAQLTGHNYDIVFSGAPGSTTFAVYDKTLDPTEVAPLPVSGAYVSGQSIAFDGLQFSVSGTPAAGDHFSVTPSTNQSIFTTLQNLIGVLNTPAVGSVAQAALTNGLSAANDNIGHALDNILTVRATVGSRLNTIDDLDSNGTDKDLQYSQTLSQLQDLDYAKAVSQLTQQQTTLTAAQQSFVKITGLSLFNYL
ncbi:MAG TPA: flagellar hook-associated protein FlgL [Burkholderiaceae bacterium]|jgi:flagellar hook-associated protein 3 FlgL